jgi:hypothetical protein
MATAEFFRPSQTGARMKVGQSTIVRWVSKLVSKEPARRGKQGRTAGLRVLDADQLRQVSGGDGGPSLLPNKGW